MSTQPPTAVWEGEFKIGRHTIRAFVLPDGTRILNAEDVASFFTDPAPWDGTDVMTGQAEIEKMMSFTNGTGIPA